MTPVTHHVILTPPPSTTGLRCFISVPEPTGGQIQSFPAKFLLIYELHVACYPQAVYKGHAVISPQSWTLQWPWQGPLPHGNSKCGGCSTQEPARAFGLPPQPVWLCGAWVCVHRRDGTSCWWNSHPALLRPWERYFKPAMCSAPSLERTKPSHFPHTEKEWAFLLFYYWCSGGIGMNQKVAKFICLIFQGHKDWVDSSNPCFPSLREV